MMTSDVQFRHSAMAIKIVCQKKSETAEPGHIFRLFSVYKLLTHIEFPLGKRREESDWWWWRVGSYPGIPPFSFYLFLLRCVSPVFTVSRPSWVHLPHLLSLLLWPSFPPPTTPNIPPFLLLLRLLLLWAWLSFERQVCCRQPRIIMPASQNMINIFRLPEKKPHFFQFGFIYKHFEKTRISSKLSTNNNKKRHGIAIEIIIYLFHFLFHDDCQWPQADLFGEIKEGCVCVGKKRWPCGSEKW